jgi:hypothetical protein
MSQRVLEHVAHGAAPRPNPAVYLLVQCPELVPDLGLGPAADLLPDTRPRRGEAQAYRAGISILGLASVEGVLTIPATLARGVCHKLKRASLAPFRFPL